MIFPWLGWVLMGAPWAIGSLAAGMLIGYGLPRSARPAVRSAAIGAALALPIYKVRPFVRVTIATSARAGQRVVVSLVDTGVLPLQVRLRSSTLLLRPGHLGTISARIAPKGTSVLSAHPWLPAWGWGLVAAVVLLPLLVGVGGLRDRRDPSGAPARSLLPV